MQRQARFQKSLEAGEAKPAGRKRKAGTASGDSSAAEDLFPAAKVGRV
jgi:hypothetical protein